MRPRNCRHRKKCRVGEENVLKRVLKLTRFLRGVKGKPNEKIKENPFVCEIVTLHVN